LSRPATAAITVARKLSKALVLPLGIGRMRREGDIVILLFHRVGAGEREVDISIETFDRFVAELIAREPVVPLDDAVGPRPGGVVLSFDDGYRDLHDHVLPVLVRHRVPAILYLATGLVANGTAPSSGQDRLTWSLLEEIVASGLVMVGSHTHSHLDLSRATERDAEEEMRRSKGLIEDRLGIECRHFASPYSVTSAAAQRAARRLFHTAATEAWRTNRRDRFDPYRLGRTPVLRSDGPIFFRAKARGALDGERWVYRALRRGPWGL
jgi:peptidoglycan/xylan/chitin deacetylase (PgdA/CDA1 family)